MALEPSQVDRENVADFLEMCAETIEKYGWVKGSFGSDETGYCAVGATMKTAGDCLSVSYHSKSQIALDARQAMADYLVAEGVVEDLRTVLPPWMHGRWFDRNDRLTAYQLIAAWNDRLPHTDSDITNTFRKVAIGVREQA